MNHVNEIMKNVPWDVKSTFNKVKNAVMNYTEMEAKVREATSNDPWGASSTLLQEIAKGTYHYQHFNEIMPMIYRRFAENRSQWRQIYKTLQLLEYLVKNGSERAVESARDHLFEVRTFQSYQFVDEKGKDQGLNVRHRAKEIAELLNDTTRIKEERQKAQENRRKFTAVGSEESRYGGFGGFGRSGGGGGRFDDYSSNYGGNWASGSGDYGNSTSSFNDYDYDPKKHGSKLPYEPYNDIAQQQREIARSPEREPSRSEVKEKKPEPPAQTVDLLLDFGAAPASQNAASATSQWEDFSGGGSSTNSNGGFADFQSAPVIYSNTTVASPTSAAPQPAPWPGTVATAPAVQQPSVNFGGFSSTPMKNMSMSPQNNLMNLGQPIPSQPFAGMGQATTPTGPSNTMNGMGAFQQSPTAMGAPANWGALGSMSSSSAQQPQQPIKNPVAPAVSSATAKKSAADILSSNLSALDSLGRFDSSKGSAGPSLNQMGSMAQTRKQQGINGVGNGAQGTNGNSHGFSDSLI